MPKKKKTTAKSRLKDKDMDKFKQLLLQKRAEIFGAVASMKEETLNKQRSDLSNVPFHMADAGSDNFELENTLGLMDEEIKLLKEIDAALSRFEKGTYGICEGSGKPIPKARLLAIPWARYSIKYKELLEKGLVHPEEDYDEQAEETDEQTEVDEEDESENDLGKAFEQLDEQMSLMGDDDNDDDDDEKH